MAEIVPADFVSAGDEGPYANATSASSSSARPVARSLTCGRDYEYRPDEWPYATGGSASSSSARPVTMPLTFGRDYEYRPEPFDSERLPITLSKEIQKFLRVANIIEREEPRVAYLCKGV